MNDLDLFEIEFAAYAYAHHTPGCLTRIYVSMMGAYLAPWRICPRGHALGYGGGIVVREIQPAIKRLREMRGRGK